MKKILIGLIILLMSACALNMNNTPKSIVKDFLDKYKNQDTEVLKDLDDIVSSNYSGEYKDRYKTLMINQYKNLEYTIKDEIIEGDTAIVIAEITVLDYYNAVNNANTYLSEHQDEFTITSVDSETNVSNSYLDNDKFLDYKFKLLESVRDRKSYTIEFNLNKENDKWTMNSLSDEDIQKIHGLYNKKK